MDRSSGIANDIGRSGLKRTKHRTVILEILEKSDQPMTAEQIFLKMGQEGIAVSLSTVYRAVESLAQKKLVTALEISGSNKTLFEYNRKFHCHYLVCLGCRKIRAIAHCPLKDYEEDLAAETDYLISGHKLVIYGYCPDCRKNVAITPKEWS